MQVGRTQSALRMQMQRLEDQVGQTLPQRTGAGLRGSRQRARGCSSVPAPSSPGMRFSPT
ncbi:MULTISPECIES: LysR family transcriptional regulator [Rhizobium]|uniref:LysR family transcriptional regulator n=1 Tax=Rhizobium TaxID=379 RepID=UPI002FEFAED9